VRQAIKGTLSRWERAGRALPDPDAGGAVQEMILMTKKHSSESFYGFTDPEEAALVATFAEVIRALEEDGVDP
jgi:hypothetical protein